MNATGIIIQQALCIHDRHTIDKNHCWQCAVEVIFTFADNQFLSAIDFYILDADDVWEMDKLEKQIAFMEKTGAAFSFHSYEFGDEKARPTGKIVHAPATLNFRQALSRTVIFTSTVMFDTENIDMEIIHMPMVPSEDTATWWRILKSGITAYGLDENLTIYRRPPKSLSSNKLIAMERIWFLYRNIANLSVLESLFYFGGWAVRATLRRL